MVLLVSEEPVLSLSDSHKSYDRLLRSGMSSDGPGLLGSVVDSSDGLGGGISGLPRDEMASSKLLTAEGTKDALLSVLFTLLSEIDAKLDFVLKSEENPLEIMLLKLDGSFEDVRDPPLLTKILPLLLFSRLDTPLLSLLL